METKITYKRLNGKHFGIETPEWGVEIKGSAPNKGEIIIVKKSNGEEIKETILEIVWSNKKGTIHFARLDSATKCWHRRSEWSPNIYGGKRPIEEAKKLVEMTEKNGCDPYELFPQVFTIPHRKEIEKA
jgi:hypothetical protein